MVWSGRPRTTKISTIDQPKSTVRFDSLHGKTSMEAARHGIGPTIHSPTLHYPWAPISQGSSSMPRLPTPRSSVSLLHAASHAGGFSDDPYTTAWTSPSPWTFDDALERADIEALRRMESVRLGRRRAAEADRGSAVPQVITQLPRWETRKCGMRDAWSLFPVLVLDLYRSYPMQATRTRNVVQCSNPRRQT